MRAVSCWLTDVGSFVLTAWGIRRARSMDRIIDSITLYTIENGMLTW